MVFFFFKQKTAYEMRISDWSSDVCSSDLLAVADHFPRLGLGNRAALANTDLVADVAGVALVVRAVLLRQLDNLLVDRMHDATLDQDGDRLVALVAYHHTLQDPTRHCRYTPKTPPAS